MRLPIAVVVAVLSLIFSGGVAPSALADDGGGAILASDGSGHLHFVDERTGKATDLGRIAVAPGDPGPANPVMTDIAFDYAGAVVYGISFDHLYILDVGDPGRSRCVGAMGARSLNGLVVAPGGRLFAAGGSGEVYEIDPRTAKATRVGSFGGGLGCSGDLAFHGGTLFGAVIGGAGGGDTLVTLDPRTGKATAVGAFVDANGPVGSVYGLVSKRGELFALTAGGALHRVDARTGKLTAIGDGGPSYWGATDFELSF